MIRVQQVAGWTMNITLKRLKPGIMLALGAALLAGRAIAFNRATDFDLDFDLDWDDLPA